MGMGMGKGFCGFVDSGACCDAFAETRDELERHSPGETLSEPVPFDDSASAEQAEDVQEEDLASDLCGGSEQGGTTGDFRSCRCSWSSCEDDVSVADATFVGAADATLVPSCMPRPPEDVSWIYDDPIIKEMVAKARKKAGMSRGAR